MVLAWSNGAGLSADERTAWDQLATFYKHGLAYAQEMGNRPQTLCAQEDVARPDAPAAYAAPARLPLNAWGLAGTWTVARHTAVADAPGGRVAFQLHARDLNLVMGPASRGGAAVPFRVLLDGQPAEGAYGTDVSPDGRGIVGDQRTYQLIRQPGPIAARRFEIEFDAAGVEVYCFTFG
jgi:hypothetical protein